MRFVNFSRGVFEGTSLQRKSRKWGEQPKRNLLFLGLIVAIGGVIGGFKYWSSRGLAYGGSGNGSDFIRPLSTGEAVVSAERSNDGEGASEGATEAGTGGGFEQGKTPSEQGGDGTGGEGTQGSGADRQPQPTGGLEGTQGESNQGSQPTGEAREGNRGSLPEGSQEQSEGLSEKETLKAYLQEKSSPLGDYVDFLYQEELNANLSGLSRLVVAIAGAEQNFGKVPNFHNLWGIKCGSNTYCRYVSLEEGIKAITSLLRKPLYGLNGQVREEDIWRIADTYAESERWPHDVVYFWNEIEGR